MRRAGTHQVGTVGVELSASVGRGESEHGLVDMADDLDVGRRAHELAGRQHSAGPRLTHLHGGQGAGGDETGAVRVLGAVRNDGGLDVSNGRGTGDVARRAPEAEVCAARQNLVAGSVAGTDR